MPSGSEEIGQRGSERAGRHRQCADQAVARKSAGALLVRRRFARAARAPAARARRCRRSTGFIVPMKATIAMKARCWTFGNATPVATIRTRRCSSSVAQVVPRRHEPDRRASAAAEPSSAAVATMPIWNGPNPMLDQIGRQDDDGEAVAKPARRAGGVEIEDVRSCPHAQAFPPSTETWSRPRSGAIGQSAGVTVKSSKYTWLSALDHRPTRPETGSGRTCSS